MHKHLLCIIALVAAMLSLATPSLTAQNAAGQADSAYVSLGVDEVADAIIAEAKRYLGYPYKYGTMGPNTFDCTGFTSFIFNKFGYKLSRSSKAQATDGTLVPKGFENLQKGDILIFGSRKNPSVVGHAGIFIALEPGGKDFTFIHASNSGVRISHLTETYYIKRFLYGRRILPNVMDYSVSIDSAATYPFSGSAMTDFPEMAADSVAPAKKGNRLVLFAGGKWGSVDSLGNVSAPDEDKRILLLQDGTWIHLTPQTATNNESSLVREVETTPQAPSDFCENAGPTAEEEAQSAAQSAATKSVGTCFAQKDSIDFGGLPLYEERTKRPTEITVPSTETAAGQAAASQSQSNEKTYHKVVSGDTLYSLAKRYGTTVSAICALNNIDESKPVIKVGQSLRIK